jgi:hypothetical protein
MTTGPVGCAVATEALGMFGLGSRESGSISFQNSGKFWMGRARDPASDKALSLSRDLLPLNT